MKVRTALSLSLSLSLYLLSIAFPPLVYIACSLNSSSPPRPPPPYDKVQPPHYSQKKKKKKYKAYSLTFDCSLEIRPFDVPSKGKRTPNPTTTIIFLLHPSPRSPFFLPKRCVFYSILIIYYFPLFYLRSFCFLIRPTTIIGFIHTNPSPSLSFNPSFLPHPILGRSSF